MAVERREYATFVSFTVSPTTYRWATVGSYRGGNWFAGILSSWMRPTDAFTDEFGIVSEDRFRVEVADPDGDFLSLIDSLEGVAADVELLTTRYLSDGTTQEVSYTRQATIASASRDPGVLAFDLVDLDRAFLENTYPSKRFTVAEFPNIFTDHDGQPVPICVGTALKVPFVSTATDHKTWHGPENIGSPSVLTVYRDGRIVGSGEYTAATEVVGSTTYLKLTFTSEQVDFNGALFEITADISSSQSRNVATELERILTAAGVTTTTFPTALATSESMLVDIGYVEPRTFSAIVQDLLLIARGHLYRNSNGAWDLIQDQARAIDATYDEDARDMIEIRRYSKARRNKTIELEYRPIDSRDLSELKHVLSRDTGAPSGTKRYICPYLRDHTAADKLHSYLAKKETTLAGADAVVHDAQIALGNVLSLSNSLLYSGAKSFIAERISRSEDANDLELREYDATIYTYSAGTLPSDATTGYQPDTSLTPPDAPTGLQIVSQTATEDAQGNAIARATVKATPPADNWEYLEFWATNDTTSEVYPGRGQDNGDGTWGTTLTGIRLGDAHTLFAVAVNRSAIKGTTASIGFNSSTYSLAPVPAFLNVAQGMGKIIRANWASVNPTYLRNYELQRNAVVIDFPLGNEHVDASVAYSVSYTYRVRSVDKSGNPSAWRTASPITINRNVAEFDLASNSVSNTQMQGSSVSSGNMQSNSVATVAIQSIAITEPKIEAEATSVVVAATTLTNTNVGTTETLLGTVNVSLPNGSMGVDIVASAKFLNNDPNFSTLDLIIKRAAATLAVYTQTMHPNSFSTVAGTWNDIPGTGIFNYYVYGKQSGSADMIASHRAMTAEAFKK